MKISVNPGRYVAAVSGGVDSMVLLHLLHKQPGVVLTVAHFDHGIRPDSHQDRLLVQDAAARYGMPFVFEEGRLGPGTSEATARAARYEFLHRVLLESGSDAITTAHHADDMLETAIINIIRGTGRMGLAGLRSINTVVRPLLEADKSQILEYAHANGVTWREDSTNADTKYLRNHIRHIVLPRLSGDDRTRVLSHIHKAAELNREIDSLLRDYLSTHSSGGKLNRKNFVMLPHAIALEVMAAWLRSNEIRSFDKKLLERLTHGAKIHRVGSCVPINRSVNLKISKEYLALETTER